MIAKTMRGEKGKVDWIDRTLIDPELHVVFVGR